MGVHQLLLHRISQADKVSATSQPTVCRQIHSHW